MKPEHAQDEISIDMPVWIARSILRDVIRMLDVAHQSDPGAVSQRTKDLLYTVGSMQKQIDTVDSEFGAKLKARNQAIKEAANGN